MDYLPLFHSLRGRTLLLVGGGQVALRKARLLTEAGGRVRVVAERIDPELESLVLSAGGTLHRRAYRPEDLQSCVLVVAATDDSELNARVSIAAQALGIPVNAVDAPQLCSVIFPAIVDRSPLLLAVSSGGAAPVLARILRARIETWIPAGFGRLAALAGRFRAAVKERFSDPRDSRIFWEDVLQGPIAERMLSGNEGEAERLLQERLNDGQPKAQGEVYLVGAGPGDPDLLTFRALRLMQQADVVLYDRLVAAAIVELCRRDAERIYVGKRRAEHSLPQPQINQLLVDLARQGKRVVRLKGGDPFIFGRGGEEIEHLSEEGIAFQVVPGITAASGCAAYAGIPLTHRDHAQSVRFVTGHLKDGSCDLPWPELVGERQTLVFYMSLLGLPVICRELIRHGSPGNTPAALVQQGTTMGQKVISATLEDLPERVTETKIHGPTLLIVGGVVSLREKLAWFKPTDR